MITPKRLAAMASLFSALRFHAEVIGDDGKEETA
jgi:hypothetical protein